PCYYGIDTATTSQLIASKLSVEEICRKIGADSLGYLGIESLKNMAPPLRDDLCHACFSGEYCIKKS
ncbi:MAG: amidophosphoribosyltransferase, partial [Clostridiales bacterium]|nr:amidophosphoribosyltransferase [Clostridiales bacterium]